MKLHKLILPSGEVISSGVGEKWAVISVKAGQRVNEGKSFRLGCVCTAQAQAELFAPADGVLLPGTELQLWQGEELLGLFTLTAVQRISPNRLRLSMADRGYRLEKELTDWLSNLDGWPYTLSDFAEKVCAACALELQTGEIPNGSLKIDKFRQGIVTGKKLLSWCAELAGCFCHVTAQGLVRFGRYEACDLEITPTGENFCYLGSLSTAQVPQADVLGVQLRDPDNDHFLPVYGENDNIYTVEGNPMTKNVEWPHLMTMLGGFPRGWTVATVQVPDTVQVQVGQIVTVFDGVRRISMPVMERLMEKGRQTLSAIGSRTGTVKTVSEEARALAQQLTIARQAVDGQTQADIFNKLTDGGKAQGVFLEDGQLYINASFLSAGIIDAAVVQVVNLIAERLCSLAGDSSLQIDGACLTMRSGGVETVALTNEYTGTPILYMTDLEDGQILHRGELSPHHLRLGGSDAGGTFHLTTSSGKPVLDLERGNPRELSWTFDSGLGKYVLTGE